MAVFSADDYSITVFGTDLSDHLQSAEISVARADLDTTNYDSNGWQENLGGRRSGTVSLTFMQDFASGEVEAVVWPVLTAADNRGTIVIKPTSASPSATNPSYSAVVTVSDWKPIPATDPAGLPVVSVSWATSGAVSKGTA
jgi:hypothetical protein